MVEIFLESVKITQVDAGWSSLVARRAHNPKVVGSNPAPATSLNISKDFGALNGPFCFVSERKLPFSFLLYLRECI